MMKYLPLIIFINLLTVSLVHAKPNCQHSQSWQCNHQAANGGLQSQTSSGIGSAGITPNTGNTNTPLGTVTPTQPIIQVSPLPQHVITGYGAIPQPQPVKVPPKATVVAPPQNVYPVPSRTITGYGAIPQPQPIKVPPKATVVAPPQYVYPIPPKTITAYGAIPHAQPVLIPPKAPVKAPPQNVYPIPSQVVTGQGAVPQPQPMAIPPKAPVKAPPQNVYPVPSQVVTGQGTVPPQPAQVPAKTPPQPVYLIPPLAGTSTQPPLPQTNAQTPQPTVIITHVASSNLHPQVLLRQQTLHSGYKFEQIEPTINNTHVDVYRGKDAAKMLYKDTLPMDKKGFHLAVLGIKEPTFTDTAEPLAAAAMRDFTFYFDFASVDIRPDQNELFSKIIDEHRSTGKRIIVVGETDNFGTEEYNRHLAVHRSTKIIEELKSRGIKDDEVELRVLVRCCRPDHPTQTTLAKTRDQRITWVHFE